jgi:hypothetical protein
VTKQSRTCATCHCEAAAQAPSWQSRSVRSHWSLGTAPTPSPEPCSGAATRSSTVIARARDSATWRSPSVRHCRGKPCESRQGRRLRNSPHRLDGRIRGPQAATLPASHARAARQSSLETPPLSSLAGRLQRAPGPRPARRPGDVGRSEALPLPAVLSSNRYRPKRVVRLNAMLSGAGKRAALNRVRLEGVVRWNVCAPATSCMQTEEARTSR